MRSLTFCLLTMLFTFSSAARAADDKTICMDAYRRIVYGDDKVAACRRFLATNTGTPHEIGTAHGLIGFAFFKTSRYAPALDEYAAEIKIEPSFVPPYGMSATSYRRLRNFDKAIEIANAAIALEPKNYIPLSERGLAYAGKGNFAAATADLDAAAKLHPQIETTSDVQIARGLAANAAKNYSAAIDSFDAALKADPNRVDAITGRCTALTSSNGPKDKLDECRATLADLDSIICAPFTTTPQIEREAACNRILAAPAPSNHALAVAHYWKGATLHKDKKYDEALAEFNIALKADPTFTPPYRSRAYIEVNAKGDISAALADYDQILKINPDAYGIIVDRANARRLNGDYDAAIADYNLSVPRFPNGLEMLTNRGISKFFRKDYDGAIADLNLVNTKLPSPFEHAVASTWLCRAKTDKGDLDGATADCEEAIGALKFWNAFNARGKLNVAKGDLDKALSDFAIAISLAPNAVVSYAYRGDAYERKKDFDNARADYQIAVAKTSIIETAELRDLRGFARQHLAALPQPVETPQPQKQGALPGSSRVALVIGNGAYKNVPALPNPPKDANAVAKSLEGVGFSVVRLADDMPRDAFLQALRAFSRDAAKADWAVVYYAGHGMEIGGVNYLIPIDAKLAEDTDAAREAVSLELVIAAVSGAKKLRLVMLDACRDNPFAETMQRSIGVQLVNKGLSNIEPDAGIMVVYATKHGETAMDGSGGHSPFATAVMSDIPKPGIEVRRLFDVVRDDVMKATDKAQQPFSYGSLPGSQDFYFVAGK